ncbi:MAG: hypothetical protein A3F11_08690 [Gammaproteobacteria bacterium RIFCSPHIGHO2_12_FULL_37_14]|nr:MAG: hypothetical protein A3F11_08690 [Gammaproteobacteria bacterium RIFCSPHIGHO2_12_FULL_37_14]
MKSLLSGLGRFSLLLGMSSTIFGSDATGISLVPTVQKIYRCYGQTKPTEQDVNTLRYTKSYRCDGVKEKSEYITCPKGYVSVGVYVWKYTEGMPPTWATRCRVACAKVTAETKLNICRWE